MIIVDEVAARNIPSCPTKSLNGDIEVRDLKGKTMSHLVLVDNEAVVTILSHVW